MNPHLLNFNNNFGNKNMPNYSFLPKLVPSLPNSYQIPKLITEELPLTKKNKRLNTLIGEEKILKLLKEQTEFMEQFLFKYKEKNENRMEIYDKRMLKFLEKSEKIQQTKVNYSAISQKIDQSKKIEFS